MALTTKVIDGDLLMLRIMFPDGRTLTMTADRNGKSVSVAPDEDLLQTSSTIVSGAILALWQSP
ncbi:hypothetical protein AAII07_48115 [Microvirga sp. 0TCS3.31]